VEKKQYDLCIEILRRFNKAGILDNFILIGSWCLYFYEEYFQDKEYTRRLSLMTRDIDFLIEHPRKIQQQVDIPELLKDLGFVTIFKGSKGYIKLDHPDLLLEFLVPEKGKGTDKPYPLPMLGMNAVTLRFLDFLTTNTIKIKLEDFYLTLPHPANFALHKLIIFQRRAREEKALKDRNAAVELLKILIDKDELATLKHALGSIPMKWQRKIIKGLELAEENGIIKLLNLSNSH